MFVLTCCSGFIGLELCNDGLNSVCTAASIFVETLTMVLSTSSGGGRGGTRGSRAGGGGSEARGRRSPQSCGGGGTGKAQGRRGDAAPLREATGLEVFGLGVTAPWLLRVHQLDRYPAAVGVVAYVYLRLF